MKDKIKEKLKTLMDKTSVSERTIDDLADSFSSLITDETLETFDFSKVIKSLDGNINAVVAKVATTPKVESKKVEEVKTPEHLKADGTVDELAKLKNDLANMQKELENTRIAKIESERAFKFKENIKSLPDNLKTVFEKSFSKMKFNEDTDFDTYLTEIQPDISSLIQASNLSGLNGSAPNAVVKPVVNDGQDSILASALKAVDVKADK